MILNMNGRKSSRRHLFILLSVLFPILIFQTSGITRELASQEKRGKEIYLKGISPSGGEITALLGNPSVEVPASVLPCVNCHGHDGSGNPEGGIVPTNLTWEALTKPYGTTHSSGRKHPPYTERLLKRAITMGIDPAGNALDVTMPRYRLSLQDIADLTAYLKQLGEELAPGLTETSIRIGVILAPNKPLAEMGRAVKAALTAYFDEMNQRGRIYNRRIDLRFAESPDSSEQRAKAAQRFIADEQVFALVATFMAGADEEIASLVADKAVPLVGAFTLYPQVGFPLNRHVFYLYSGLNGQGRALAAFATARHTTQNPQTAIIYSDENIQREVVEAIEKQCKQSGWTSIDKIRVAQRQFNAKSLAQELTQKGTEVVFFLASGEAKREFLTEAEELSWTPIVLVPGSLAGQEVFEAPMSFHNRIFLSFPTLPSDQTPGGAAEYRKLAKVHKLPATHLATQLTALSSAKILVEGLRQAGRDLSREKLISAIEELYHFQTGFTPSITYNPNRRVGAFGAHIVSIDLKDKRFVPASEWIELTSN